jgi:hypothetical protein
LQLIRIADKGRVEETDMTDLVQRLATGRHALAYTRGTTATELKAAIDRGYVLLKFTQTRGGTELGVPLDPSGCRLDGDFGNGKGTVHLEGNIQLDYVPIRVIADLDLATLKGEGQVQMREASQGPAKAAAP